MEKCAICLEIIQTRKWKRKFQCTHVYFHNSCIESCTKCPLCRADMHTPKRSGMRILIWNESQRECAHLYKCHNMLQADIVVINSIQEKQEGDIMYSYRS